MKTKCSLRTNEEHKQHAAAALEQKKPVNGVKGFSVLHLLENFDVFLLTTCTASFLG